MSDNKEKFREFFNKNAKGYSKSREGAFTMPMYPEMITRVLSKKPKKVLDLGCGSGILLKQLNDTNNNIELFGLDIADEMIKIADESLKGCAELKVGDCEKIPWDSDTFDVVFCNASFHHYPNPNKALLEVNRVLKSNGTLIIGDPTAPVVIRDIMNFFIRFSNSGDVRIYNEDEILDLLKEANFTPNNFKLLKWNKFFINADVNK